MQADSRQPFEHQATGHQATGHQTSAQLFRLGDIQVSAAHNSLHLGEQSVKLQPKAMAVLQYLAQHQERVISAQELMAQLWAGRIVTQASVQKSINAIRSGLNELQPQREFIQFFSKRGYQLQVAAEFCEVAVPASTHAPAHADGANELVPKPRANYRPWAIAALTCVLLASGLWWWQTREPDYPKLHHTQFSHWQAYTEQPGHQRAASPNPDGSHVAYITEAFIDDVGNTQSQLIIRDSQGKDWQLARTQGSWFKLAWSPSGQQLAAIEVNRIPGRPLNPNFYERANFIYTIHFFTLDLARHQLLEKQTLSQWQGRIFSLSWWDEDTLELVAKQGPSAGNARYRYSRTDQRLTQMAEVSGASNPYSAAIFNKTTLLARNQGNQTQLIFLDASQQVKTRYLLPYAHLELSWIPDGSGLLAFAPDKPELLLIYRDGSRKTIALPDHGQGLLSRPVFAPAGDKIYFTREQRKANIQWLNSAGEAMDITHNALLNFGASISPDGQKIIFATLDKQVVQLSLIDVNGDSLSQPYPALNQPLSERLGPIVWSERGDAVFFNAGNSLYQLGLADKNLLLLLEASDPLEALGLINNGQQLVYAKTQGDSKNLWVLDLNSHQQKQLTFGSLGSVLVQRDSIYLQYLNAAGLWQISDLNMPARSINPNLPANVKMLSLAQGELYFLTGGACHESPVLAVPLNGSLQTAAQARQVLARPSPLATSLSFHPHLGLLQTPCQLHQAHVVALE